MSAAKPPEFRRLALDLVAQGGPVARVAKDLGISESLHATGSTPPASSGRWDVSLPVSTTLSSSRFGSPCSANCWNGSSSLVELASAIFECIEGFYNPCRHHTALGIVSPHDFETLDTAATSAA